jgi:thiamine-phosphate pyrophosphorylase
MKAMWVTDRAACGPERFEAVLAALAGASGLCVQLREKNLSDLESLALARRCRGVLGPGVPLLVNRRFDIALSAGASGTHLPSDGLSVGRVRANTPRGFRIGVSAHSTEEAAQAIEEGADLVVLGPIFDTPSKRAFGPPLGLRALDRLPPLAGHRADVYAIGGIAEQNLEEITRRRDRVSGAAAIRLFQESPDPKALVEKVARL